MKIDPSLKGHLPTVEAPKPYRSPDGRLSGWRLRIPGQRPLATPAIADGKLFLGGGFGSYDFYAFDAVSGRLLWQYQTSDDGPTAAVVLDDLVAFNTESCELEVLTTAGRSVWKKWLGDPLMSMPALAPEFVFQAFPNSTGDRRHHLGCFELRTGVERWRTPIPGEIITAPVLADGNVYLTTLDGTMTCVRQSDGAVVWQELKNATSSPCVRDQECYFSQRKEVFAERAGRREAQQTEHVAACGATMAGAGTVADHEYSVTSFLADHLDHVKRAGGSPRYMAYELHDAGVGFAYAKGDAKMHQAMYNLGQAHVSGLWAYQGSKPFVYRGRMYSALGDSFHCVDPKTEQAFWRKKLHEAREQSDYLDHILTPPALVNGKAFVGSMFGDLSCLSADSGEQLWQVNVGESIMFQPAVASGRVYAATAEGSLICLETGDASDDGWFMWGANASHNGLTA
ncbi:MAG: PQQ-binding-like beta-propeller repeat protein [Gemmataceae bacterium]|nr:PQQ-binding-like beta-propeller repeat protein [Gemmataceae bacterium]